MFVSCPPHQNTQLARPHQESLQVCLRFVCLYIASPCRSYTLNNSYCVRRSRPARVSDFAQHISLLKTASFPWTLQQQCNVRNDLLQVAMGNTCGGNNKVRTTVNDGKRKTTLHRLWVTRQAKQKNEDCHERMPMTRPSPDVHIHTPRGCPPSPDDLLLWFEFLSPFLDADSLSTMRGVNRESKSLAEDEDIWKALCLKRWEGKHIGERSLASYIWFASFTAHCNPMVCVISPLRKMIARDEHSGVACVTMVGIDATSWFDPGT